MCGLQRTLAAPVVSTVLHGCHTRLEGETTFRRWWFVDAEGQVPGKLAAKIVKVIMGKHKPIYDRSQVSRLLFVASSLPHKVLGLRFYPLLWPLRSTAPPLRHLSTDSSPSSPKQY